MIVHILIWSLFDSRTTIDELQQALLELEPPSEWVWSEASERFGIVLSATSFRRVSAGRVT